MGPQQSTLEGGSRYWDVIPPEAIGRDFQLIVKQQLTELASLR